jgi:hypothetical protein
LFLFSSPFSMLCILVWTAPAGVYISRYSSRRQAPRLRTLPLLFLQFKPNVATYSQAAPSPGTYHRSPRNIDTSSLVSWRPPAAETLCSGIKALCAKNN